MVRAKRKRQAAGTARALSFRLSCPSIFYASLPNDPSWVRIEFNLLTKKTAKRFMGGEDPSPAEEKKRRNLTLAATIPP
jgi:hypothetical protein